jgi:DUF1009 family protein
MADTTQVMGIIAGNRSLPLLFAREARAAGIQRLVAIAFDGETDPALGALVDDIVWLKVGQLNKMIDAFHTRGVTRTVMLGQVTPKSIFDVRPDLRAMALLLKIKEKNAHTIFGALANELSKEGVELTDPRPWLKPIMPGLGFLLGPRLDEEQTEDVAFGYRMAKEISRLEIGQSVVVKKGVVLAVEGFEGTDGCLRRGGELAGKDRGAVAVKVAKEKHDVRFDIPCIGVRTLEICRDGGLSVLAFEQGMTLVLDREQVEKMARQHKISVVSVG